MKSTIKVLLADDHGLVRSLMKERLEGAPGVAVVAEAASGEEAIRKAKRHRPDVVLLDVNMPGIGGIETARIIRRVDAEIKIVIVSVHESGPFPIRLLEMGVDGYLTKSSAPRDLEMAVRTVIQGRRYVDAKLAQTVLLGRLVGGPDPMDTLSARELEIFSLIIKGQRVSQIANRLCRSPKTISTLRGRLMRKLEVDSDVQLALFALERGLLEPYSSEAEGVEN